MNLLIEDYKKHIRKIEIGETKMDNRKERRIKTLDSKNENMSFRNNIDILNDYFGANRTMYMHACYPQSKSEFLKGENPEDKFFVWMPKLYRNSSMWKNTISSDGEYIYEVAEENRDTDWIDEGKRDVNGIRLVFAKADPKKPYRFMGVYVSDKMKPLRHTYRRIATRIRLIGNPVTKVVLLDDSRGRSYNDLMLSKDNFVSSLNLPSGVTAYRYNGMDRVHFKYDDVGFLVIDMRSSFYHLGTREKYLKDLGNNDYEYTDNINP